MSPKVNVVAWLDFELTSILQFCMLSHFVTGTFSKNTLAYNNKNVKNKMLKWNVLSKNMSNIVKIVFIIDDKRNIKKFSIFF